RSAARPSGLAPAPVPHLRHVLEVLADVTGMALEHGAAVRHEGGAPRRAPARPADRLEAEIVAAHPVAYDHVEGRGRRALLVEAAHVEALGARAAVNELVDRTLIAVEGEDHRRRLGEEGDERRVGET